MDNPKFEFRTAQDRPKAGGTFSNPMVDAMEHAEENLMRLSGLDIQQR